MRSRSSEPSRRSRSPWGSPASPPPGIPASGGGGSGWPRPSPSWSCSSSPEARIWREEGTRRWGAALTGWLLRPPMSRHRMATLDERLVSLVAPHSYQAEQYRGLRHLVEQAHRTSALSALAVSSAPVGDGKTTTAIHLAGALAQAPDARILLT